MSDIAMQIINGEFHMTGSNDDTLLTAILVRLYTDRRDDTNIDDKRGYFGDAFLPDNRRHGSHLWTMQRQKINSESLRKIENIVIDALSDLKSDGIVSNITAAAVQSIQQDKVNITIELTRNDDENLLYQINWDNTLNEITP